MDSAKDSIKTSDGLSLAAVKVGNGLPAVLVPNRIYMQPYFIRLAERHTIVFYDPRNRGESEAVADPSKLARGIHHEAEDTEVVHQHYGFDRVAILAHSYACVAAVLYGIMHPSRVSHLILIGPPPPDAARQYPPELKYEDATTRSFYTAFAELQKGAASLTAAELCAKAWALLRVLYVGDAENADKLKWEPCGIPNEVNFMTPFMRYIMPSLSALRFTEADFAKLRMPVLIVHGRRDRSAPYGGGCDWAAALPNARLLTIDEAAHTPWIEAPERVFAEIEKLLLAD